MWPTVPLQSLMSKPIQYGIVQRGEGVQNGVPCIRVADMGEHGVRGDGVVRVSAQIHRKYRKTELQAGELLFALRGDIGRVAVVPPCLAGANIHRGVARLAVDPKRADAAFVALALTSSDVRRRIQFQVNGSALQELPIARLRRIEVPALPLPEQRALARRARSWQEAVYLLDAVIAARRRLQRGLMRELLTGGRRFARFADAPWAQMHVGDLFEETSRPIEWDDTAQYDLVSIRRRSGGVFVRGRLAAKSIKTKMLFDVHAGDLLISKMQAVHGAIGLAGHEHEGMKVSGSYVVLRPKTGAAVQPSFFAYLTHLPQMYRAVLLASYGVHIEKMTFNLEWYLRTPIHLPESLDEQNAIADILSATDREISLLERQRDLLDLQRQAVIDRLLLGEPRPPGESDADEVSA